MRERRFASEAAARYGLTVAYVRAKRTKEAEAELARVRAAGGGGPMIESLAARVKLAQGDRAGAAMLLGESLRALSELAPAALRARRRAARRRTA